MMSRPAPKHAPRVPFVLLLLGLLVGGLTMLLVLNTASAANELRRHDLAAQDDNIAATVEQLRNEVAASMAPNNLARVASQLGMVPAGNPAFLDIGADGKVRVLGSPAPATAPPVAPPKTPQPHSSTAHPTSTATKSATSTASTTATSTATKTATKTTKTARSTASTTPTKTKTTPTPDPTATTTLPGGTR